MATADFSSNATLLLQQLVVVPLPAAGEYTIGVYCASSTSFSVSAFLLDQLSILPLPYGVVYPGFAPHGDYQSYSMYAHFLSVYVDPLRTRAGAALQLSLYSLSGAADLYCSNSTAYPNPSQFRWLSNLHNGPNSLNEINIPPLQLPSGLIYCSVFSYIDSSFTFTAFLQSPLLLGPEDVVFLQTAASQRTLASIVVYASPPPAMVVISVAAQYGATAIYANPYGRPAVASRYGSQWLSDVAQPLQAMPLVIADVCAGGSIPDSNPPQCGINLLVLSPVASQFRVAVDVSGSGAVILPGQTLPGAVVAGGLFLLMLDVPGNFLNASLLVSMQGDADNATLSVGRDSWNRNSSQWVVSQTLGQPLLQWTIDPTDPQLAPSYNMQGAYWAVISAPVATSFSVLYTLTNASGYDTAPTQLIDGEPQYGLLARPGQVSFFTFTPPASGWPYSVVVSCTFVSGTGVLTTSSGDGSVLGPTPGSYNWYGRSAFTTPLLSFGPTDAWSSVCNPSFPLSSDEPCLYQLVVQSQYSSDEPLEFYLTVSTTNSLRFLRPGQSISSILAAGSLEYWQLSADSNGGAVQTLAAASLTQGEAVLYGSNSTLPSASTAQQQVYAQPVGFISYSSNATSDTVYYFVAVNCSALLLHCVYSMQFSAIYPQSGPEYVTLGLGQATSVLLGAGGTAYGTLPLNRFITAAYVLLQSDFLAGSASAYWAANDDVAFPNSTSYQWTTSNSTAVEISNLNLVNQSVFSRALKVTVQAGATPVLLNLQVDVAGATAVLYAANTPQGGLLIPAFPVSYYVYTLTSYYSDLIVAVGLYSSDCPQSTRLYVSDRQPQPGPGQQGVSYNYTGSALVLPGNSIQVSAILSGSAQFNSSLRNGPYYIAVVGDGQTSCSYQISVLTRIPSQLLADEKRNYQSVFGFALGLFYTFSMQPDTDASFALYNFRTSGTTVASSVVNVYTVLGGLSNLAEPGNFSVVSAFNVSAIQAAGRAGSAIYLPGSLCPVTIDSLANGCPVVIAASTSDGSYQTFSLVSMQTATQLTAGQLVVGVTTYYVSAFYAMPVPVGQVGNVSLTMFASSPLQLYCSYQYIRPTALYYDWTALVPAGNSTAVNISWSAPLLNSVNGVAPNASTCYCGVAAETAGFTLAFAFIPTAVPPPPPPPSVSSSSSSGRPSALSSSSGLSSSPAPSSVPSSSSSPSPPSSSTASASSSQPSPPPSVTSSSSSLVSPSPPVAPSSDSSSSGLSTGVLIVAIFVPVLVAVLTVAALLWLCRRQGGCGCRGMLNKEAEAANAGRVTDETEQSERTAPMGESELQSISSARPRVRQSRLLDTQSTHSDY